MVGRLVSLVAAASLGACGFQVGAGTGGTDGGRAPADQAIDGPPTATQRRVKLSFKNSTRAIALDNFVVLVVLDAARVDYAAIKPNGANLRFTDPDGTLLAYQIDEWSAGGTSYVWVRVPQIDASSNTDYIYLHYGDPVLADAQNPTAVWANHRAVWHLSEDPGPGGLGQIKDATGAHDGTASAMATADRVASVVGNGMHFGGNGEGITATAIVAPTYTWSMWIRGATAPALGNRNKEPINNGDVNFNFAWDHSVAAYVGAAAQRDATQWRSVSPAGIAAMTWYFLAGTYDGTNLCVYRDSAASCVPAGAPLAPAGTFTLGLAGSGGATFNGWIDEVRVLPTALSAKRLDAELVNQRASVGDPFVVFSPPELEP